MGVTLLYLPLPTKYHHHIALMPQTTNPVSRALVVLSGGQDSTTCLFWATERYGPTNVFAVTYDYGQRHSRELEAARKVANLAKIHTHEIIKVGSILKGRSPLTDPAAYLEQYDDFDSMTRIIGVRVELTFVPMRNALFLTLAANYAYCRGISNIVTGVCQEDNANYPDCRESFIVHQQNAINHALGLEDTGGKMMIYTPLMWLTKAASIERAMKIPGAYAALAYTHTAYDGKYPPTGKDHASVLRARGFKEAGVPDPLVIRAWRDGLMPLPDEDHYHGEAMDKAINLLAASSGLRPE